MPNTPDPPRLPFHAKALAILAPAIEEAMREVPELSSAGVVLSWKDLPNEHLPFGFVRGIGNGAEGGAGEILLSMRQTLRFLAYQQNMFEAQVALVVKLGEQSAKDFQESEKKLRNQKLEEVARSAM